VDLKNTLLKIVLNLNQIIYNLPIALYAKRLDIFQGIALKILKDFMLLEEDAIFAMLQLTFRRIVLAIPGIEYRHRDNRMKIKNILAIDFHLNNLVLILLLFTLVIIFSKSDGSTLLKIN